MADLIERDNTIKEIDEHLAFVLQTYNKRYGNSDNEYIAGYKIAHEHIKEVITLKLPSVQPELPIKQKCTICPHCDNCDVNDDGTISQPEPQWIPCSEPPKESGTYIVTAYDGIDKRVTFVKYQKTLKRWNLTGARAYWRILAYKPLPEPWRGEEHETDRC